MYAAQRELSNTFQRFFDSEKSSGVLLVICTVISLLIANSSNAISYLSWWQSPIAGLSVQHWINDALMAFFFLFIGLELERELYSGELSNIKNALLPIFAALGGVFAPALIHYALNSGSPSQPGIGIPMATDIAFALGIVALLGARIPSSLKVFIAAFAVIDDLCAIIVIALFYTAQLSLEYLAAAIAVWIFLYILNRRYRVMSIIPYLLGGGLLWFFVLKSGIHATIAGVMLAFAIPYSAKVDDTESPSHRLEHFLHKPIAFFILPIFALANTAIPVGADWIQNLSSVNSVGIFLGLVIGKPLGVTLFCFVAVLSGICRLPSGLNWLHIFGAGILGGIGFTMSIFITNLAFAGNANIIDASKIAILLASLAAGILGFLWFILLTKPEDQLKIIEKTHNNQRHAEF